MCYNKGKIWAESPKEGPPMPDTIYSAARIFPAIPLKFDSPEVCVSSAEGRSEGTLAPIDAWSSTDYLDISGHYGLVYELHANYRVRSAAFFDAEKRYLSGIGISGGCDHSGRAAALSGFCRVPDGAVYARFVRFAGSERRFPIPVPLVCAIPDRDAYDRFAARFPFHDKKIACIGDSLTEGDYGYRYGIGYIYGYNFPFFLGRELGCHVDNYGVCGATSSQAFGDFAAGKSPVSDADVITVMLGTNHGLDGKLGEDYLALLDGIDAQKKPDAKIVLLTPPHVTSDPRRRSDNLHLAIAKAAGVVRRIAAERGLEVIDALVYGPLQDGTEEFLQSNDGVHMTEQGYRAFASFVRQQLVDRHLL